ncbi:protein of unknown function DUF928 [Oscillatoria nigro-viridis PCC 7112]|uniref:DUF928 domain-containing protein n=1 Tax=Phormidium nigroviride PCC 7112 TaxID=179408 RepID=K9VGM0_9CYAN|nr:DUF928 domain-containing protein [Oscillatoria nigro-viridis]AFZ06400.1 protein of unknown function DUF928 [Oscillatoria nigro-viridis PCC 7112]
MALKSALNIGALSLILSLEAVAAGSFLIPAEALNSPANIVQRPSRPQLPLNWQTVQPPEPSGSRPNIQLTGAAWNSFQPPEDGVPGRREGGGTRGLKCPAATTALTALIPQSTMGQTISAKPTFFYYLPVALDKTVQFELADERDKTLYKKSFRLVTSRAGVVSVSLGSDDNSPALEVGKNYQWYFTIKCNPKNTTDDVLVSGWINRTALAPTVKIELDRSSDSLAKLSIFAQQGLWYEYLATLAQLRIESPSDASLALKWSAVLNSVELGKIAQEPLVTSELTPITKK